jgi:adenosine deaminase
MTILQSENHLHLYGCLSADSLFEASFDRAKKYEARFQWFISEFEKATGRKIKPEFWWNASNGREKFRKDFICSDACTFNIFQAKFNLLIALFPPTPDDMALAEKVFASHVSLGGYKEYRTFLPLYLNAEARTKYLDQLIKSARSYETSQYHPRIAISFSRQDADAWDSYRFLLNFLDYHPDARPLITGIDFCGNEQGHPPEDKRQLFKQILTDRRDGRHSLEVLYHVGEMWQDIGLHSAARWCVEAAQMGIDRLGHALALAMNPESLGGRTIRENISEAKRHLQWINAHRHVLHDNNYTVKDYQWFSDRLEQSTTDDYVTWHYDVDLIEHTRMFQNALLSIIKDSDPLIETCPTSNIRIGQLGRPEFHPLRRFLDHQIRVTISTDDPGIFDIDLGHEESLVQRKFGLTAEDLSQCDNNARSIFINRT